MNFLKYLKDKFYFLLIIFFALTCSIMTIYLSISMESVKVNIKELIYAYFLFTTILFIGFLFDYLRNREKYIILNKIYKEEIPFKNIAAIKASNKYEDKLYRSIILRAYSEYENKLKIYERESKFRNDFNNMWIHQMKTPVSVLKLLLEKESLDKSDKDNMQEEVDKIASGLEMGLYSLKINNFEEDFKVDKVCLLELVRDVINENKINFIVNKVYPSLNIDEDIYIHTDFKWMRFVVNQLIQNSIKYTKVKDINPRKIEINVEREVNNIILKIKDNGVGIDRVDIPNIFKAFYTGENGRMYSESTGMGLYVSKIVLDKLGHLIEVKSEKGNYSEFKISFIEGRNIYNIK